MVIEFPSMRPLLVQCTQAMVRLEEVLAVCDATDEEWQHIRDRTASSLANDDLRHFMLRNGGDIGNSLEHVRMAVETIRTTPGLEVEDSGCESPTDLIPTWKRHVSVEKQNTEQIRTWAADTAKLLSKYRAELEVIEDSGSTSSYSDYSGDDTDTTDDGDDGDERDSQSTTTDSS